MRFFTVENLYGIPVAMVMVTYSENLQIHAHPFLFATNVNENDVIEADLSAEKFVSLHTISAERAEEELKHRTQPVFRRGKRKY